MTSTFKALALVALAAGVTACSESSPTEPTVPQGAEQADLRPGTQRGHLRHDGISRRESPRRIAHPSQLGPQDPGPVTPVQQAPEIAQELDLMALEDGPGVEEVDPRMVPHPQEVRHCHLIILTGILPLTG